MFCEKKSLKSIFHQIKIHTFDNKIINRNLCYQSAEKIYHHTIHFNEVINQHNGFIND